MTVRINKDALNLREELTKAQGVVRYEQRQFWMDGLVENGTFDTADGWALGAGWSVSGGALSHASGTAGSSRHPVDLVLGKRYKAVAEVTSWTGGTGNIQFSNGGTTTATIIDSVGSFEVYYTAEGNNLVGFYSASTGVFSIGDIAVFEVDENDNVIHSVPLGFKPVHVYEDGLLQREGENHDYTVVNSGAGYQIKPTVAPSATTETCVIAEREL